MSEMFSPERVTAVCKQYGLVTGLMLIWQLIESLGLNIARQPEACHWVAAEYVVFKTAGAELPYQTHVP